MTIDEQLKHLAVNAQQHPPNSLQRRRALTRLVSLMNQSGQLVRPYAGQFHGLYDDIYAEAKQRLFLYVCEHIDRYDPTYAVLQWANFLMKKRFFVEASRDVMPTAPKGMDRSQVQQVTLDVLDKRNPVDERSLATASLSDEIIQYIQEDPDETFRSTHIVGHPAAHFQYIALRFLAGYAWKEIAAELDIKVVTLSSFYQRCLTKFAPLFRDYLIH